MPLTVGGGVRFGRRRARAARAGADKVGVNTRGGRAAGAARPSSPSASAASASCSRSTRAGGDAAEGGWEVVTHGGRQATGTRRARRGSRGRRARRRRDPADLASTGTGTSERLRPRPARGGGRRGAGAGHRLGRRRDGRRLRRGAHGRSRGGARGVGLPYRRDDAGDSQAGSLRSRFSDALWRFEAMNSPKKGNAGRERAANVGGGAGARGAATAGADLGFRSTSRGSVSTSAGLLPVIAQDAFTGRVLMLAWANREAVERTLATGDAYFWSRSRRELWRKGETLGQRLRVVGDRRRLRRRRAAAAPSSRQGRPATPGRPSCFEREPTPAPPPDPKRAARPRRARADRPLARGGPTRRRATPRGCSPKARRGSRRRSARRRPRSSSPRWRRSAAGERSSTWSRRRATCSTTSPCSSRSAE